MRLNCLSCGHSLDLHDDYDDYEGQVKCYVCGALLTILAENGHMKRVILSTPQATQNQEAMLHSMSS